MKTKYKVFIRWYNKAGATFDGDPNVTTDEAELPAIISLCEAELSGRIATNTAWGAMSAAIIQETCTETEVKAVVISP